MCACVFILARFLGYVRLLVCHSRAWHRLTIRTLMIDKAQATSTASFEMLCIANSLCLINENRRYTDYDQNNNNNNNSCWQVVKQFTLFRNTDQIFLSIAVESNNRVTFNGSYHICPRNAFELNVHSVFWNLLSKIIAAMSELQAASSNGEDKCARQYRLWNAGSLNTQWWIYFCMRLLSLPQNCIKRT